MELPNTPSNPAALSREIGPLAFTLTAEGLAVEGLARGPLSLSVEETIALRDFFKSPGAASLVNRAWLAAQFVAIEHTANVEA